MSKSVLQSLTGEVGGKGTTSHVGMQTLEEISTQNGPPKEN